MTSLRRRLRERVLNDRADRVLHGTGEPGPKLSNLLPTVLQSIEPDPLATVQPPDPRTTCTCGYGDQGFHTKACSLWTPRPECVSLNADGSLDEVVLRGVDVHIEQMSDHNWFVGIYRPGTNGDRLRLGFHSKRRVHAFWEDEGINIEVLQEQETPDGWRVLPAAER